MACTRHVRIDMAFANPSLISGIRDMNHFWYRKEVSDHTLVSVKMDFETTERGHGIFRCPSELHLDPSYQCIIESSVKKWLIDRQPESDEKLRLTRLINWLLDIYNNLALIRQNPGLEQFEVAERVCNVMPIMIANSCMQLMTLLKWLWSSAKRHHMSSY